MKKFLRLITLILICVFFMAVVPQVQAISYKFTSIDYPGAGETYAHGINDNGQIVGNYFDFTGAHGFLLSEGIYSSINHPSGGWTVATGINNNEDIVGRYQRGSSIVGFLLSGGIYTDIQYPGAGPIIPEDVNDKGQVVGLYGGKGGTRGFLLSEGIYTTIDYFGAYQTQAHGINNNGQIVGFANSSEGFLLSEGVYNQFDYGLFGINDIGEIVGNYWHEGDHGFLLSEGVYSSIDFPGATDTFARDINNNGQIVGRYDASNGIRHGFLAIPTNTPIPEPSTWLLVGSGLIGLAGIRKRFKT